MRITLTGLTIWAAVGVMSPGLAQAEDVRVCGASASKQTGEVVARFGDIEARCLVGEACSLISRPLDPAFPDGFRQALRIEAQGPGARLVRLSLTSRAPAIDLMAGARLVVGVREFDVSDGLSAFARSRDVVHVEGPNAQRALALVGSSLEWRFTDTIGQPARARFSLRGLRAARAWAGCMAQAAESGGK
jgi:hypothetical protein